MSHPAMRGGLPAGFRAGSARRLFFGTEYAMIII